MASSPRTSSAPVTFDLPLDLLAKIETCRASLQVGSVSEVIRTALARFDFATCQTNTVPHRQISVRLTAEQRTTLKRYARLKDASVGELLRLAVEALPVRRPKAQPRAKAKRR